MENRNNTFSRQLEFHFDNFCGDGGRNICSQNFKWKMSLKVTLYMSLNLDSLLSGWNALFKHFLPTIDVPYLKVLIGVSYYWLNFDTYVSYRWWFIEARIQSWLYKLRTMINVTQISVCSFKSWRYYSNILTYAVFLLPNLKLKFLTCSNCFFETVMRHK